MSVNDDDETKSIRDYARRFAKMAINTCVDVMENPEAKDTARVMAGKIVLERGFGMPERKVEQEINHHIFDERQAHLDALKDLSEREFRDLQIAKKSDRLLIEGKVNPQKSEYEE